MRLVQSETVIWVTGSVYLLMLLIAVFVSVQAFRSRARAGESVFNPFSDLPFIAGLLFELALIAFSVSGLVLSSTHWVLSFIAWLTDPDTGKTAAYITAGFLTVVLGIGLFAIRLFMRFLYGVVEVASAILVAVYQVGNVSNTELLKPTFALAFLTAAVYLTVRGLDNIHTALKATPPDPSLRLFRRRWANTKT